MSLRAKNADFIRLCNEQKQADKLRRHRLIRAGKLPNRLLGETVAPIVHRWWVATDTKKPMSDNKDYGT